VARACRKVTFSMSVWFCQSSLAVTGLPPAQPMYRPQYPRHASPRPAGRPAHPVPEGSKKQWAWGRQLCSQKAPDWPQSRGSAK
jgi:hypothetical protein